MGCVSCGRELHAECSRVKDNKCCCRQEALAEAIQSSKLGKNYKDDDDITVSAGRKRAGTRYEIIPEKPCAWRWQKNCGGGKHPIIGCLGGMQEHRHHGPVKNTSRNEPENVHLICTKCHNRWHTLNDEDYDEVTNDSLPHKPVPATLEECSNNEIDWTSGRFREKVIDKSA